MGFCDEIGTRGNNNPCMMPEVSRSSAHVKQNELGPDYFGYYKHEIVELFSQNEDFLSPFTTKGSESSVRACGKVKVEDVSNHSCSNREGKSCSVSVSLFSAGLGEGLSDFKKERLKATLKQSVKDMNHEVDEILDHVLAIHQCQTHQRENKSSLSHGGSDKQMSRYLCKKQKTSSSPVYNAVSRDAGSAGVQSSGRVSKDFEALLENDGLQPEEALRKPSDDLFAKLEYMERHLEEFLDTVVSKCRAMTYIEKQHLRKRIQKLPAKALDRVTEIITHRKPSERHACDELYVDLNKEDNVLLWRLHYYVEAVEIANELTV